MIEIPRFLGQKSIKKASRIALLAGGLVVNGCLSEPAVPKPIETPPTPTATPLPVHKLCVDEGVIAGLAPSYEQTLIEGGIKLGTRRIYLASPHHPETGAYTLEIEPKVMSMLNSFSNDFLDVMIRPDLQITTTLRRLDDQSLEIAGAISDKPGLVRSAWITKSGVTAQPNQCNVLAVVWKNWQFIEVRFKNMKQEFKLTTPRLPSGKSA